jgi:hypothetical protein
MKFFFALFLIPMFSYALDMSPGLWEYQTELSVNPKMKMMLEQLKNMPPAQRNMVKKMIEQKMGGSIDLNEKGTVTRKCLSKNDIANMQEKLKKEIIKDGCKFKVNESSKTVLKGSMNCDDKKKNVTISLVMGSSKSGLNETTTSMSEKPIKTSMKWVKSDCAGKKKEKLE